MPAANVASIGTDTTTGRSARNVMAISNIIVELGPFHDVYNYVFSKLDADVPRSLAFSKISFGLLDNYMSPLIYTKIVSKVGWSYVAQPVGSNYFIARCGYRRPSCPARQSRSLTLNLCQIWLIIPCSTVLYLSIQSWEILKIAWDGGVGLKRRR